MINANDPNTFLNSIREKSRYDTELHWNQPCAIHKKKTDNHCYTMSKLLDWKQTYHQIIDRGIKNYQSVQQYIKSASEQQIVYRLVLYQNDQQ